MKIYQVHRHGGVYDDYSDIILKTFISKEKAEKFTKETEEKVRKEKILGKKCEWCPYLQAESVEEAIAVAGEGYCLDRDLVFSEDDGVVYCGNYCSSFGTDITFEIVEVDVEE